MLETLSKTSHWLPIRSHSPPDGSSLVSRRESRSKRKRARRASTAVWSSAASQRESAEREGRWSRPKSAMNTLAQGCSREVVGFQRPFATDSIAEEDGEEINDLIASEPAAGKAYLRVDAFQHPLAAQMAGHEGDFSKPGWRRWHEVGSGLDGHGRRGGSVKWFVEIALLFIEESGPQTPPQTD